MPGTGARLTGVTTNSSRYVLGSHTVTGRTTLKSSTEAAAALNARFVVYTTYGQTTYAATRIGNEFMAVFNGLRTDTRAQGSSTLEPYVVFRYTYQGVEKEIYIGALQIIVDPGGRVIDALTGSRPLGVGKMGTNYKKSTIVPIVEEPIEGAYVTLYRQDDNNANNWLLWEPHDGQVNPQATNATGEFIWDVEDGTYMIMVYHPDYNTAISQYSTLMDPEIGLIVIPPERYDIVIRLYVTI